MTPKLGPPHRSVPLLKDALHINRPMPPRPIPVCWDVKLGHDVDPQGQIAFNLDREEPPPVLSSASEVDKPKKEKNMLSCRRPFDTEAWVDENLERPWKVRIEDK